MEKSTHKVEVVRVILEPHPNADSLSVVRVFGGYTVCVRTEDWRGLELGAYLPPDSIVDSARPEFAFLAGHERIRVKRLRGVVSMGLLIPAPSGLMLKRLSIRRPSCPGCRESRLTSRSKRSGCLRLRKGRA